MLRLRPTYEEMLREAKTRRLKIQPERERRTQQGMLLENVDFDEFDLSTYDIRNPNKATQTDIFDDNSNYSSATSNRSIRTMEIPTEGQSRQEQQRQTSVSTGESMDDVRYRTRMSIADDLATMARVGGNIIYYTGQGIGRVGGGLVSFAEASRQGIAKAINAYNWINEDNEDDEDIQPPVDEEVFQTTQRLMRRGASRSRSITPEERASGSNDAIRLLRRGASRSRSETPPDVKKKSKKMTVVHEIIVKIILIIISQSNYTTYTKPRSCLYYAGLHYFFAGQLCYSLNSH